MLTRCPQCETIFRVAEHQLTAREGLVRCGRCLKVFKAEDYAYDLPGSAPTNDAAEDEQIELASGTDMPTEVITERVDRIDDRDTRTNNDLPSLQELLWGKKRSRTRPIFWFLASLFLLLVFLAQGAWFFATELARQPKLAPWIEQYCLYAGCVVMPQRDVGLIELSIPRVAPHPRYQNVLRVKGSVINRAPFSQEFPLIEVSLSNRRGDVVARRTFDRELFLTKQNLDEQIMFPNVRFPISIEFINPDPAASGFEVRLVAPPLPKKPESIFSKYLTN